MRQYISKKKPGENVSVLITLPSPVAFQAGV